MDITSSEMRRIVLLAIICIHVFVTCAHPSRNRDSSPSLVNTNHVLSRDPRQHQPTSSAETPGASEILREVVEQLIDERLEASERRLEKRFQQRLQQLNQTLALSHLEKLLHLLNEELFHNRDQLSSTNDDVTALASQVSAQRSELEGVKSEMGVTRLAVEGLTLLMDKILEGLTRPTADAVERDEKENRVREEQRERDRNRSKHTAADRHTDIVENTRFPIDCQDAYDRGGLIGSGYHFPFIQPRLSAQPLKACCYINNGTGWTVMQRRVDGSVDFYRKWQDYKRGFGDIEGEFWIGNDVIHQLTAQGEYRLRIEMLTWEDHAYWAEYKHFRLSGEAELYRLHVEGYSGNAGNSLSSPWDNNHNGQPFSTVDSDNDKRHYDNCAEHYRGAWWFNSCFQSHLNGLYYPRGAHSNFFIRNGVQWNTIHPHSSLKHVSMMIRMNTDSEIAEEFNTAA